MNILAFPGQGSQKIGMGKIFYENFRKKVFPYLFFEILGQEMLKYT